MKYPKAFFALVASLSILFLASACHPDDPKKEQPAEEPVFNHWQLQVNPYEYPNYSLVYVQLQTAAGDTTLLDLSQYEVAAINSKGLVAGLTEVTNATSAEMCIFGEAGDQFSFRLWDCLCKKERELHGSFSLAVSESIPVVTLY